MTTVSIPVYLDTDVGVDDAMALLYLLATPDVHVVGIGTVSGNVSAEQAAQNALDLLDLAGRTGIPVALGAHDFQARPYDGGVPHIHGENGLGGIDIDRSTGELSDMTAAQMLVALARDYPGELRVIAIGPLTNIAEALRLDPELPSSVHSLVAMGGAAIAPGNLTPVAEANIGNDPEAAAEVLAAQWNPILVPLDVTMAHTIEPRHAEQLTASPNPAVHALGRMIEFYAGFYTGVYGRPCVALHDPLAAALAVGDITAALAPTVRVTVDDTDGPGRGQTICDMRGRYNSYPAQRGARCTVVLELHEDFAPHLVERLLTL
ncbi:nucleoside hydrolase [Actinomycetes bacterium M1A6_2h]